MLSPAAWAVPPDHDNRREAYGAMWRESYRAIATSFGIASIGVSNVGMVEGGHWDGWRCIGCSLAVGADGADLVQAPYGAGAEALITVDVELPQP